MDYVLEQLMRQRSLFVSLLGKKPSKRETVEVESANKERQKLGSNSTFAVAHPTWTGIGVEEKKISSQSQPFEFLSSASRMDDNEEWGGSTITQPPELAERGERNGMTGQWLTEVTIGDTTSAEDLSVEMERDARRYDGDLTLF